MKILINGDVPDSTYFRVGDCEPYVNGDGNLVVYEGRGSRRSWGSPQVTSTVIYCEGDFVAIHVGFSHKHGGGQFWRYFSEDQQLTWGEITDELRAEILAAADKKAPRWAKSPGKLRKNYKSHGPVEKWIGYKVMRLTESGDLTSLYDPDYVYELGKTRVQAAKSNHGGGHYVHLSLQSIVDLWDRGLLVNDDRLPVYPDAAVLVACECWGNVVQYDNGKISVTYCKPVEIVSTF